MKRRHQVILFAVLLLSLTILSPSFDFRGSQLHQERNQKSDTYPGASSRYDDTKAPLDVVVAMSKEEFSVFQKIAKEVAVSHLVEIKLRNVERDTYEHLLTQEFSLGETGDVLLLDSEDVQKYAKKGYLFPLNGTTLSKSLGDSAVDVRILTEWNGYQWGMPFDVDPYILAVRTSLLNKAGLESLPRNKEQWSRVIKQALTEGTPLLALNIDDPYAANAFLNHLQPEMGPEQILNAQALSHTGEIGRGIQLLNEIQPHIAIQSSDPRALSSNNSNAAPMLVSVLSQFRYTNEDKEIQNDLRSPMTLQALGAVKSRSLVIAAGSVEKEAASRWIEGMTSSAVQLKWNQYAKRLPARQVELKLESQKLAGTVDIRLSSWLSKEKTTDAVTQSLDIITRSQKSMQQFLKGELNAGQFVSSITKANSR